MKFAKALIALLVLALYLSAAAAKLRPMQEEEEPTDTPTDMPEESGEGEGEEGGEGEEEEPAGVLDGHGDDYVFTTIELTKVEGQQTEASGEATIYFTPSLNYVSWEITFADLAGDGVITEIALFHEVDGEELFLLDFVLIEDGEVSEGIELGDSGEVSGSMTIEDADHVQAIFTDEVSYMRIITAAYSAFDAGELRGDITGFESPPDTDAGVIATSPMVALATSAVTMVVSRLM